MDDYKQRVKAACEKFASRQLNREHTTYRKNDKPEQLVVSTCIKWMRAQGWDAHTIESKAQWDKDQEIYRAKAAPVGFSDCVGCLPNGCAVFVEFKAKGKLSTLKDHQRIFLEGKINKNCFACCVDSVDQLEKTYKGWRDLKNRGQHVDARQFLLELLPKKRVDSQPLFP
jgi:hypothetical protein